MAFVISISDQAGEKWWLNNSSAWIFFDEILPTYVEPNSRESDQIEIASAFHGVALHDLHREDPEIARKLARAMRAAADDLAEGIVDINAFYTFRCLEETRLFKERFKELANMLSRWEASLDS